MIKKIVIALLALPLISIAANKYAFTEFQPTREFVYKTVDDFDLKLSVFDPVGHQLTDEAPVIILFFGGGWVGGQPCRLAGQCDFFAKQGIVAITADYRVKGRNKTTPIECVKDGTSAVRWVRAHAAELGIDPKRVIVGGASAGGHVAATTGTGVTFDEATDDLSISSRANALVLFNPVFDNGPGGYGHDRVVDYWEQISPMHNMDAETPPTIALFGDNDKHVPVATAKEYQARMEAQGHRCDLKIYEGMGHGFFNYRKGGDPGKNKYFNQTLADAAEFLTSLGYIKKGAK